jgi:hypothetical protein
MVVDLRRLAILFMLASVVGCGANSAPPQEPETPPSANNSSAQLQDKQSSEVPNNSEVETEPASNPKEELAASVNAFRKEFTDLATGIEDIAAADRAAAKSGHCGHAGLKSKSVPPR